MKSVRVSTASIALLLLCLTILNLQMSSGFGTRSVPGDPAISISIDKEEAFVDVAPWSKGEVNFTVTVFCQIPMEVSEDIGVEVQLNASAWYWGVSEIPLMTFSKERKQMQVEITITAFINSSAYLAVDLEMWGSWNYTNSNESRQIEKFKAANIFVLPFFDLYLGSNSPVKYADIGDWTEFSFNISNRANMDVNITIELVNDNSHLEIEPINDTIFMKKGETRTISFRIRQEPSRSRGNTIHVHTTIKEDINRTRWDLPLMYYTDPTFSTFFYERNFLRLVLIIGAIVVVALGLFLWERMKHQKVEDPEMIENTKSFKGSKNPPKGLYKENYNRQR